MAVMQTQLKPNELQEGVGLYAALAYQDHRQQLWQCPAGIGKSRMIRQVAV